MTKIKDLLNKIQGGNINRKIQNLIIIGLLGIALVLAGTFFFDGGKGKSTSNDNLPSQLSQVLDYESKIKNQLEGILETIEGVGRVEEIGRAHV